MWIKNNLMMWNKKFCVIYITLPSEVQLTPTYFETFFLFNVGYYVRKYIYNYYSRKRYLEGIVIKNEVVRWESLPCYYFLLVLVILVFNPLTCKSD